MSSWPGQPLSFGELSRATRIAARDRELQSMLGSRVTPSGSFVWLRAGKRAPVVVLRFALRRKIRVGAIVPYAVNPPDAPATGDCRRPYAPGWERLRARQVTRIFVAVDLLTNRVADISTDAKQEVVSPVAGRPYPHCDEKQPGM